jgi:uncharacterized protein YhdP
VKHLSDSVNPSSYDPLLDLAHKSGWRRALEWMLGLLVVAWFVVLMAWSALHVFIVPRIGDYRESLQQQATRALGLKVELGAVNVQGGWWVPWLELQDIRLFDKEGREALRLPRVMAAVSPLSVLRGRFEQLAVDQPRKWVAKVVAPTGSSLSRNGWCAAASCIGAMSIAVRSCKRLHQS